MKISRLLGIVTLLLNRQKMTAKELAEYFEVSQRTILRDLEALDQAGIPVVTTQGQGGGVGLMEGYTLDRQYFSAGEIASVLTAIEGISTLIPDPEYRRAKEKLGNLAAVNRTHGQKERIRVLNVDMSPWAGGGRHSRYLNTLLNAAQNRRVVEFSYSNMKGECVTRQVEPYQVIFKGSAWYLAGYCLLREDFRIFRISRMRELESLPGIFSPRDVPKGVLDPYSWDSGSIEENSVTKTADLHLRFASGARYRVVDFFGDEAIKECDDGSLEVNVKFPEDEWVYSFLLSFGPDVEILRPKRIRNIIQRRAALVAEKNQLF